MRSLLLISLLLPCASFADGWTTDTPIEATLVSFDKNCATLKSKDGQIFKIQKSSLNKFKLVSGETKVEFFEAALKDHACDSKK